MHWRVLAELADLLAEEVFPGDALPALCRWLAATTGTTAAILLLTDDAIDDVVAWPPDEPLAVDLAGLVGQPLDERSTICTSVRDGRTISGPPDDAPTMPGGGSVHDVGGWAAVPIIDRTVAFGAIFIAGPHNEAVGDATVHLLEEVAQRVARALFNCEEAASSAATGGNGLPAALRDRLGALSFVLGGIQASTGLLLAPEDERKYTDIAQQAVTLHARIDDFLTGRGGASE
jgi:hypothetical protein